MLPFRCESRGQALQKLTHSEGEDVVYCEQTHQSRPRAVPSLLKHCLPLWLELDSLASRIENTLLSRAHHTWALSQRSLQLSGPGVNFLLHQTIFHRLDGYLSGWTKEIQIAMIQFKRRIIYMFFFHYLFNKHLLLSRKLWIKISKISPPSKSGPYMQGAFS